MSIETKDAQDLEARRRLKYVVGTAVPAMMRARELLRAKAERSPSSAEAEAFRELDRACHVAAAWLSDAGGG